MGDGTPLTAYEALGRAEVRAPLWRHAQAQAPREACGLVVVERDGAPRGEPAENLADHLHAQDPTAFPRDATTAFVLDVRQIVAAERRGARLVAIVHSHVEVGSYFSAEDRRLATTPDGQAPLYPGVEHVVLDVRGRGEETHVVGFRVFRWDESVRDFAEMAPPVGLTPRRSRGLTPRRSRGPGNRAPGR